MSTQTATHVEPRARTLAPRQIVLSVLGPLTALVGVAWAIAQPYRITLLHPYDQGFWWLFVQPPLWILLAGLAFHLFVARPLIEDLDA
jgi:hypothetical protein